MKTINTLDELTALYGTISPGAIDKQLPCLTAPYKAMIEASPFVILATQAHGGIDCSPRGDLKQAVFVEDMHTLLIPDRRGNNRLDSLRNIVRDPEVGLIFLIPGKNETLRVRGRATVFTDDDLAQHYAVDGKLPVCFIRVDITTVLFQCGRAVMRSRLWEGHVSSDLPTAGEMMKAAKTGFDGDAYDKALPARQKNTLY